MSFRSLTLILFCAILPGFAQSPPPAEAVVRERGNPVEDPGLEGLKVRILHTSARKGDARKLSSLFAQTGLKTERIELAPSAASSHEKVLYYKEGYAREAEHLRLLARNLEELSLKQGELFNDGQQFNLWVGGERQPLLVRCIYVENRRQDALRVKKILEDHGYTVELYLTGDNGNASHTHRLYTRPGFEKRAAWIAELVEDIEPLTVVPSDHTGADGQTFNLWIAD